MSTRRASPRLHRHRWYFYELRYRTPERVSPVIEVVYKCDIDPRHTYTRSIRPRVPSTDALTDEQRFERASEKRQQRSRPRPVTGEPPPTDLPWESEGPGRAGAETLSFEDQAHLGHYLGIDPKP